MTLPEIIKLLGLDRSSEPALRRQMELLQREGILFSQRRGRWSLHARARFTIGRLSTPRSGYGFVLPEDGSGPDAYVPGRKMGGARHGDLVLARLGGGGRRTGGRDGSTEAEIVAVLERRSPYVAGLFRGDARTGVVTPRDERIASAILVDQPAAKVPDGAVVWVEVTSPGSPFQPARGRIHATLGRPEDPGVDRAVIERQYGLPGKYPEAAEAEARSHGARVTESGKRAREDFTTETVVTVDPRTARDHDDAVSLARITGIDGARYRLAVHIADVARYVPEGGQVDAEARRRGTSVYFPGYSIPMLPEILSSHLCSLVPGEDRLVQSVIMEFDAQGKRTGYRFADGVIRSSARLTYEEVARLIERGSGGDAPYARMLLEMEALRRLLRSRRMQRGSLDLDLPETEITVDAEGRPVDVRLAPHTAANEMIEEFMLAANETVAEHLHDQTRSALFRIHEDPDPSAITQVEERLMEAGYSPRRVRGSSSARIRGLLEGFKDKPEEPAVAMMVLRSLKLARYSHEPVAHFGLAAPLYTHFTSPIRRYPDLVVHRSLRSVRREAPHGHRGHEDHGIEQLATVADECSRLERRAEEAERAMVDWKTAVFMSGRVGEQFLGMVTGMTSTSLFVTLEGMGVDGIVSGGSLEPGRRFRRHPSRAGSSVRLGDRVSVVVQEVDTFRARIVFKLLSPMT